MKNERGITLIALVVTIVVLLILAGVTITYALGNNGIFEKAQEAQKVSEQSVIRDAVTSAQAEAMMEYYDTSRTGTASTASALIGKYIPSGYTIETTPAPTLTEGIIGGTVKITTSKYTHTVTIENGVVTAFTSEAV